MDSIRESKIAQVEVIDRRDSGDGWLGDRFSARVELRHVLENRVNPQLNLRHDEAADVVRDKVGENLVRHRYVGPQTNGVAKLGFAGLLILLQMSFTNDV